MTTADLADLERKLFRFMTYIPENSPISYSYDSAVGSHHFRNEEGYLEHLELSCEEFQYLLEQQRLPHE